MKLYGNLSDLTHEQFTDMLSFFYPECNKLSIYFPNDGEAPVMSFKEDFLEAIDVSEADDETSVLEPKEGFSMVIASFSDNVKQLLARIEPSFKLSFGMMYDETLVLFIGEEGEIAIDSTNESLMEHPIFSTFTKC